jgi:hypothetical protein
MGLLGNQPSTSAMQPDRYDPQIDIEQVIDLLREGDLICRRGKGLFSTYCASFSSDKLYSHAGIITLSGSEWSVIHAAAEDYPQPGCVILDSFKEFIRNTAGWAVYRFKLPKETIAKTATLIKGYKTVATPFDLNFDLSSNDELYCTELIYTTINQAAGSEIIHPSSERCGRRFVSVEDCYSNGIADLVIKFQDE